MKRLASFGLAVLILARAGGPAADADFDRGMQAASNSEWDRALEMLERALAADADNVRYGSEYRQAVLRRAQSLHPRDGKPQDFDRSLKYFEELTGGNPRAANAYLNFGFAYVDMIPAAGSITQVILANTALSQFTKSLLSGR